MPDKEVLRQAKYYMDMLARGVNPISNMEIPKNSVLDNIELVRCFLFVSDVLTEILKHDTVNGKKSDFYVEAGQMQLIPISKKPLNITQFVENINTAVANPQMKKLSTTTITDWLLGKGFLEITTSQKGRYQRTPTENGRKIGLITQTRQGRYEEYQAVLYNVDAQRFVLDHLDMILRGK